MLQLEYTKCSHRYKLHNYNGNGLIAAWPCPGCRSHRPFVKEGDEEEKKGKAIGVSQDGCIHIYSERHLSLRRHRSSRATIRASKRSVKK